MTFLSTKNGSFLVPSETKHNPHFYYIV